MASSTYTPQRVMVIAAHPDDIEFSCAGTVARWVREGAVGCYVICTSGQVGIKDPSLTLDQVAAIREREQRAAAKVVGVEDVVFLGYLDGWLENTLKLRGELVREIRRFRPEVVITSDPTVLFADDGDGDDRGYINHPDHRAAAAAALDALFPAAGMPLFMPELAREGLEAHETRKVYVTTWRTPNTWVDISDTIELKIAALRAHASQMGDWDPSERIRAWAAGRGKGKEMAYAEAFRVITLRTDEEWAQRQGRVEMVKVDQAQSEAKSEIEAR